MSGEFIVSSIILGGIFFLFLIFYISIRTLTVIKATREGETYTITVKRFLSDTKTYQCDFDRGRAEWRTKNYQGVDRSSFLYEFLNACVDAIDIKKELEARGFQKDEEVHA